MLRRVSREMLNKGNDSGLEADQWECKSEGYNTHQKTIHILVLKGFDCSLRTEDELRLKSGSKVLSETGACSKADDTEEGVLGGRASITKARMEGQRQIEKVEGEGNLVSTRQRQCSSETHVEGSKKIRRQRINLGRDGMKARSSRTRSPGDATGGRK